MTCISSALDSYVAILTTNYVSACLDIQKSVLCYLIELHDSYFFLLSEI